MIRKTFRAGNSTVVSIPQEFLDAMGVVQGQPLSMELDRKRGVVLLRATELDLAESGVDADFARKVSEFISEYRTALEELAE